MKKCDKCKANVDIHYIHNGEVRCVPCHRKAMIKKCKICGTPLTSKVCDKCHYYQVAM